MKLKLCLLALCFSSTCFAGLFFEESNFIAPVGHLKVLQIKSLNLAESVSQKASSAQIAIFGKKNSFINIETDQTITLFSKNNKKLVVQLASANNIYQSNASGVLNYYVEATLMPKNYERSTFYHGTYNVTISY